MNYLYLTPEPLLIPFLNSAVPRRVVASSSLLFNSASISCSSAQPHLLPQSSQVASSSSLLFNSASISSSSAQPHLLPQSSQVASSSSLLFNSASSGFFPHSLIFFLNPPKLQRLFFLFLFLFLSLSSCGIFSFSSFSSSSALYVT